MSRGVIVAVGSLGDPTDRDLVRRVAEGDEEAFRDLFRRYGSVAKALALKIIRQPFLAEEITQEAFLALWRRPRAYREDRGSVRAWLMSTVHHRAVDLIRREEAQRRRAEEMDPGDALEQDVGETFVEEAAFEERRAAAVAALGDLPPEQRQVLEMMYFEGKSQSKIAGELGLPLGTVKSRTLLGMRRLRVAVVEETG
jgi:RNA polymerase sigma factor (sigma-70 family)